MLATSIAKLPPPAMQSRGDDPLNMSGSNVPNYQDLVKDFGQPSRAASVQGSEYEPRTNAPPPISSNSKHQMQQHLQQQLQPEYEDSQQQYQYQQEMPVYQPQQHQYRPQAFGPPPAYISTPPPLAIQPSMKPKNKILSMDTLKSSRAWFAAAVIFAFVWFGIPKLKSSVPSVISPLTGDLGAPGLAVASVIAGMLIGTASDHFFTQ